MLNVGVYVIIGIVLVIAAVVVGCKLADYYYSGWFMFGGFVVAIAIVIFWCSYGVSIPAVDTTLNHKYEMTTIDGSYWGENTTAISTGRHSAATKNEYIVYVKMDDGTIVGKTYPLTEQTRLVTDGEFYVEEMKVLHKSWLLHWYEDKYILHVSE